MNTFWKVGFISLTCAPGFWGTGPYDGKEQLLDLRKKIDIHAVHSQAQKIGEALRAAHSEFPLMYPPKVSIPPQAEESPKLELLSPSPLVRAVQRGDDQVNAKPLSPAEGTAPVSSEGRVAVSSGSSREEVIRPPQSSKGFQEKRKFINRDPIDVSLFFPEEDKVQDRSIDPSISESSEPLMDLSLLLPDEVHDPTQPLPEGMLIDVSSLPLTEAESCEPLPEESVSKEIMPKLCEKGESRLGKPLSVDEGPMDIAWLFEEDEKGSLPERTSSLDEISKEVKEAADRIVQDIVLSFDRQLVTPTKEEVVRKLFEQSAMVVEQLQVLADDLRIDAVFQEVLDQLRVTYPSIDFEACSSLRQAWELWGSFMDSDLESARLGVQVQERGLAELALTGDDSDLSEGYSIPGLVSPQSFTSLDTGNGLFHSQPSCNASTLSQNLMPVSSVSLEEKKIGVSSVNFSILSEEAWKDSGVMQSDELSSDLQNDGVRSLDVPREASPMIELSGGDELIEYLVYDEMRRRNEVKMAGEKKDLSPTSQDALPKLQTQKADSLSRHSLEKNLFFDPKKHRVEPRLEDETIVEEVGLHVMLPDVENGLSSPDNARPGREGGGGESDSSDAEGINDRGEASSYTEASSDSSYVGASSEAQPREKHNSSGQATAPQRTGDCNQMKVNSEGDEKESATEVVSENSLSAPPIEAPNEVGFASAPVKGTPVPQELKKTVLPQAQQETLTESPQGAAQASSLEVEAPKVTPTQGLKFVAVKIPHKAHYQSVSQILPREEMPIKERQAMPDPLGLKAETFPRIREESLKKVVHQATQFQEIDVVESEAPRLVQAQLASQVSPEVKPEALSETTSEETTQSSRLEKELPQTMPSLGLRRVRVTAPQQARYQAMPQVQVQPKEENPILTEDGLKETNSQGLNSVAARADPQAETRLLISTPSPQAGKSIVKGKEKPVLQTQRIDVPKISLPEEADLTMDASFRIAPEGKGIRELQEDLKMAFQKLQAREETVITNKPTPEVNSSPVKAAVSFGAR